MNYLLSVVFYIIGPQTPKKRSRALRFRAMSRTRQSKPNRSRTVASNVAAAVVGKVVVAVNSNHAVGKVAQNLQARNLQKNRLAASAMPNRQANNNVAAVRVNLPLRSNLLCRAMPGIRLMNKRKTA